jgi:uncharacterized protein YdcH (DUF465 family)
MITPEKLKHHISHLQEKHDKLDKDIRELEAHHSNHEKVVEMKKEKLHLKDEIEKFKSQL